MTLSRATIGARVNAYLRASVALARGIATAMVRWLAREARGAGATTVFRMAGSRVEERIYARIGFKTVGEMLHISRPADG